MHGTRMEVMSAAQEHSPAALIVATLKHNDVDLSEGLDAFDQVRWPAVAPHHSRWRQFSRRQPWGRLRSLHVLERFEGGAMVVIDDRPTLLGLGQPGEAHMRAEHGTEHSCVGLSEAQKGMASRAR